MLHEFNPHEPAKPVDIMPVLGGWIKMIINLWASFIYAFTRHTFGAKYYAARAFFCVILLWVWESIMAPHANVELHMLAGGLFFFLAIAHQIGANRTEEGLQQHSRFNGIPRLCSMFGMPNNAAKMFFEPILALLIGWGLFQADRSLGAFVMIGGVACMLDDMAIVDRYREKARRMRDSELEQDEVWDTYDRFYKK